MTLLPIFFVVDQANKQPELTKTTSRTSVPLYARSSKPNNLPKARLPTPEASSRIKFTSWPRQRSRRARNSDALSASARTTKKAATGKSRRKRRNKSKTVRPTSQDKHGRKTITRTERHHLLNYVAFQRGVGGSRVGSLHSQSGLHFSGFPCSPIRCCCHHPALYRNPTCRFQSLLQPCLLVISTTLASVQIRCPSC